jgi:hypothetical protein
MATIRIPSTISSLLPYCGKWENTREDACFPTYAALIVFAASYGYERWDGSALPAITKVLDRPNPIDLSIFKDGLYSQILLLALAVKGSYEIAQSEDDLCRLVEGFADFGGRELSQIKEGCGDEIFVYEISRMLEERGDFVKL